ncbi:MAG TPA: adenylate/guanylate cyclase domain-containing protein, partial [Gemmatimonadota bacterium]|nr:adenylate/guanylate cyclase domain-containing protein [Gemmatimonadota bacterium]
MNVPKDSGEIQAAIERLESQRAILGDEAVDLAVAALSRQIAMEPGAADRTPRDARAEGERKLVTVMFADVSGFTELAAGLDPEEVRDLMNRCFDRLVPVIQRYEGTVDKFVGDAIVALFGAPVSHEDDPQRALRTAEEMLAELERFNAANQTDLGLHFGINTGTVVAGSVGAQERQDYSVMGDAVNMAARLEDLSSRGEVLVGHDTVRLAGPGFVFDPLPEVAVKGKSTPIRAYRLLGARTIEAEAAPAHSPLVGRTAELERIQAAIGALREGTGGRIAIVAEAGLGKSRLVAEARRSNGAGVRWAEGRGLSHAGGSSNGVARELVRSLLELRGEATPSETERALTESIEALAPAEVDELRPYLTHLLELSLDDARVSEKVRHLGGEVLRKRVVFATRDFIRRLARREPLVLVWEDLHWADASSIDLLEGVMDLPDEAPLLILLVFRLEPGRALDLHRRLEERHGERYEVLPLLPLSDAESGALMAGVLQVGELPGALQRFVLGKAEGNPFYVQEILRELVDAGTVTRAGEKVVVRDDLQSVRIPDTLQGVLGARIDRLEAADKRALQAASVIGRIFPLRVLASLLNGARPPRLEDSIDELCRRAFLRPSTPESANGSDGSEYIFQHVITQEVAYRTILRSQRRELHRRVAELMERLYPDRSEELASVIGFHHQRAG